LGLLAAIRLIFAQHGVQRLFSSALVDALRLLPERPWSGANNGDKHITAARLARRLSAFNVHSQTIRIGQLRAKGYDLADFALAFARFLLAPQ